MTLRKSLKDISFMVRDIEYPAPLPDGIRHLHCYVTDGGHSILAVPKPLLGEAIRSDCQMYEVPLPVKYVLRTGWTQITGTDSISVDVPYSLDFGAMVPDGYDEF